MRLRSYRVVVHTLLLILLLAASAFAQSTGDLLDAHKAKDWDTQPNGSMNANLNLLNSLFPLLSCGDSTHTISWNPVTKKMGCQALTVGSGDGSIKVTDYGLTCDGSTAIWTGTQQNTKRQVPRHE